MNIRLGSVSYLFLPHRFQQKSQFALFVVNRGSERRKGKPVLAEYGYLGVICPVISYIKGFLYFRGRNDYTVSVYLNLRGFKFLILARDLKALRLSVNLKAAAMIKAQFNFILPVQTILVSKPYTP